MIFMASVLQGAERNSPQRSQRLHKEHKKELQLARSREARLYGAA